MSLTDPTLNASNNEVSLVEPKCSRHLKVRDTLKDFSLQRLDRLVRCEKLYGREDSIQDLRSVLKQEKRCFVSIEGPSGSGKTVLVAHALRPIVEKMKGFYVSGKFDLAQISEPYSVLKQAMSQLVQKIIDLGQRSDYDRYTRIRNKLLEDIDTLSVLYTMLPEMKLLLRGSSDLEGENKEEEKEEFEAQVDASASTAKESVDRLNFAFRKLIQTVTQCFPLVVVCDDCQWSDKASINLIRNLIVDLESPRLMIACCLRTPSASTLSSTKSEVDKDLTKSAQLFYDLVKDIERTSADRQLLMHTIELGNLRLEAVHEMIVDVLSGGPSKHTKSLADVVYKKTLGNVFYLIQFLQQLAREDLLQYSTATNCWMWDLEEVREKSMATKNVVELLNEKLRQSQVASSILPVAACLGSRFSVSLIGIAMTATAADSKELRLLNPSDVRPMIQKCQESGFLESMGDNDDWYAFVHDKIQEASLALVQSSEELKFLRRSVGEALNRNLQEAELDDNLFSVVNLLNAATVSTLSTSEVVDLANLNYRAGMKALKSSAFEAAVGYLDQAQGLLPEQEYWTNHFDLSLRIFTAAAEASYCVGRFDTMTRYCESVLRQEGIPLATRYQTYSLLVDASMSKLEHFHAINLSYQVLKEARVHMPRKKVAIATGILRGLFIFKRNPQDIITRMLKVPLTTDPLEHMTSRLIDKLGRIGMLSGRPDLLALCCLVNSKRSFTYRLTPHTPLSMSLVAFVITCVVGDFQVGLNYANLSLQLLEKWGDTRNEAITVFTVNVFVMHWTMPFQNLIEPVLGAYRAGMRKGDIETAGYSCYYTIYLSLESGVSLETLEGDASMFMQQMHDFGQFHAYWYLRPILQAILNLRGKGHATSLLTGEAMDEDQLWNLEDDKELTKLVALIIKVQLAAVFGEFDVGAKLVKRYEKKIKEKVVGLPNIIFWRFAGGLCCYAHARQTGSISMMRLANKCRSILSGWLKKGNPNIVGPLSLLDAEAKHAKMKAAAEVISAYETAIRTNARSGLTHLHALSSERLASFYLARNEREEALHSLNSSIEKYEQWGAIGKAIQLRENVREIELHSF